MAQFINGRRKMKINLHCHSNYSDGYASLSEMAEEHQKQGFSAFVVTDHCYPSFIKKGSNEGRFITSYDKYCQQSKELKEVSKKLDYPCIQGIELALYGEEVLVFGDETIKKIFEYVEDVNSREQEKYGELRSYHKKLSNNIANILKENKSHTAIILCHPHLFEEDSYGRDKLFELIDGYEFQNSGHYLFSDETHKNKTDREIPAELQGKRKFYNSDAHALRCVGRTDGNFHENTIHMVEDLIDFIKTPQNTQSILLHKIQSNQKD